MTRLLLSIHIFLFCSFVNIYCMEKKLSITKEILKISTKNRELVPNIALSNNQQYFLENVSTQSKTSQVHLWENDTNRLIKTFEGYNQGEFSPDNKYIIIQCKYAIPAIGRLPYLYSIAHDKSLPLISDKDLDKYGQHECTIDSTSQYIIQELQNTEKLEKRLLHYNSEKAHLSHISLDTWGTILKWFFWDKSKGRDSESCIIYLNDKQQIIKRSLESSSTITYSLDKKCKRMWSSEPLISILHSSGIASILLIEDNKIKKVNEIKYNEYVYAPNLISLGKELMCYQTDLSTFTLLDSNHNILGSYTLPDYSGELEHFLINSSRTCLVVLYTSSSTSDSSKIAFFDLSHIQHNIQPTKIITDNMYIKNIAFINDRFLLTQGTETKIFDIDGNTVVNLGQSQASTLQNNVILTLYHTPSTRDYAGPHLIKLPVTTTISRHTIS